MKKLLKWATLALGAAVLATALLFVGMRFHDGPIAIVTGGPFETGELTEAPDEWSFLADRAEIEFQTMDPPTSRTVWLGVHEGRLFVVSGYMTTWYGGLWKKWPHHIERDDRVVLRIDGRLYERRLERVLDGPDVVPVLGEFGRKYGFAGTPTAAPVTTGEIWMYEVVAR